ncbi:hypothetical protein [Bacillus solimangrovi]|uniref:Uncharacterized protein n=1 Tax=Bacillus solimangrovi TaxID=1305675 RepID=A0A1E5LBZ2_9BACI|nr:hypothetical protein [Bacillus solimangrovi]OEH91593.1 hypothetical protein BFG57_04255 [Bacillus solimangrovi]
MSHKPKKENICIRVPKVYDWVTRQVDLPLISFTGKQLNQLKFDCDLEPCGDNGHIRNICEFLEREGIDDVIVDCFLSDRYGNRIDPKKDNGVLCQEIIQPNGREEVKVKLPDGDEVTLQKVKVLLKGFVGIELLSHNGEVLCHLDEGIPFATAQTFFLCAPKGTEVNCHLSFFECDASLICTDDFEQLDISITLCIEVQMEAYVKIEVEGKFCEPRPELPISPVLCSTEKFPPQCPDVFPNDDRKDC